MCACVANASAEGKQAKSESEATAAEPSAADIIMILDIVVRYTDFLTAH